MKQARLAATLAALLLAVSATAFACDEKGTKASSASASNCTAAMAAKCTPAQAAACKAKGASAVTASTEMEGCSAHAAAAAKAKMSGCPMHDAAVTAGSEGSEGMCSHAKGAKATAAGMSGCAAHGAMAAGSEGTCSHAQGAATMACPNHTFSSAANGHADCDGCESCADMANCEQEIDAAGATMQVVPLKNGVMYVYTAENASKVRLVQAVLARRAEHLAKFAVAGNKAKLCPPCKELRGASASGKLAREVVNIEGGCLTLMTSNDPAIVAKIRAMAGVSGKAVKS